MNRQDTLALTRRLIENSLARQTDLAEKSCVEDAGVFNDPERHQRERQQFFRDTPQVVACGGNSDSAAAA